MTRLVVAAFILAALMQTNAMAGPGVPDTQVNVNSNFYLPDSVSIPLSPHSVTWKNVVVRKHTATSDGYDGTAGPNLWFGTTLAPLGTQSVLVFDAAGIYRYHCALHDMHGKVRVPMTTDADSGPLTTTFKISWANSDGIPSGFSVQMQIAKPGNHFKDFGAPKTGSDISVNYTPLKTGKYRFRSRLINDTTHGRSDYSQTLEIKVT